MALELERERPLLLRMTEDEFDAWSDADVRAEFVDGKVLVMPPAAVLHIRVLQFLIQFAGLYVQFRPTGEIFSSDLQVRLRPGLRRLPDLVYLKTEHAGRLGPTLLEGPADAVWEIISRDSEARDWRDKLPEYEAAGIPEYWIVNPYLRQVHLHVLEAGKYQPVEEQDGKLASAVIPDFWLRPEWLWQEPLPKVMDCLRELGVEA